MLGIKEQKFIVTGKFADAVRKAAVESVVKRKDISSSKTSSQKTNFHFEWK